MTEKEFRRDYMGKYVSDKEIIEYLEKENKELKWQLKEVIEDNDYYQKENKRLDEDNKALKKHCKAVDEVNEKMKCCHNCKNFINKSYCITPCNEHNEWELEE